MKRSFMFLGIAFSIVGVLFLLEGRFTLSVSKEKDLDQIASRQETKLALPSLFSKKNKDVIVSVYGDRNNQNEFYVAKFHKNTLIDFYSLDEIQSIDGEKESSFYSVVSSPLNDYAIFVDLEGQAIQIFEGTLSSGVTNSIFMIFVGFSFIAASLSKKQEEKKSVHFT